MNRTRKSNMCIADNKFCPVCKGQLYITRLSGWDKLWCDDCREFKKSMITTIEGIKVKIPIESYK